MISNSIVAAAMVVVVVAKGAMTAAVPPRVKTCVGCDIYPQMQHGSQTSSMFHC